jgi:DNA-binding Xre family transcriptional regulator/quercetin dioxygenase-like cupin family protein
MIGVADFGGDAALCNRAYALADEARAAMTENRIEDTARRRLRGLRVARGWTLDELARRSGIGASTISRIETGHRRLAIDQLADLARALETTIDDLLGDDSADDVVIRPTRNTNGNGVVHWPLTRMHDPSGRVVAKMRIPASKKRPETQIHPGREWFYVLDGVARLVLGEREHLVEVGQAAEFDTMTPHWVAGHGGPVDVLTIFDRQGEQAHLTPARRTRPR